MRKRKCNDDGFRVFIVQFAIKSYIFFLYRNLTDSAKGRRLGPLSCSDNGVNTKNISVAEDDDRHKEGVCGEDCAESTSQADQGGLDFDLKEVASGTPELLNTGEFHPGQKPLSSSVEVSMTI